MVVLVKKKLLKNKHPTEKKKMLTATTTGEALKGKTHRKRMINAHFTHFRIKHKHTHTNPHLLTSHAILACA